MTSVMPKGVEHNIAEASIAKLPLVMTSVMPKGVEHRMMRYQSRAHTR